MTEPYELYYWPILPGRGEFVRLVLEEAAVPYVDVARLPEEEGGGFKPLLEFVQGERLGQPAATAWLPATWGNVCRRFSSS